MTVDPRITRGLAAQFAARKQAIHAGAVAVGWKAGLGSPAAMAMLGTDGPLVGYLTDATLLSDGAQWSLDGRTAPRLEPEIAVRVNADGVITAAAPAIELADMHLPLDDPEQVLACDIFHSAFILGTFVEGPAPANLALAVDGEKDTLASSADPFELIGRPEAVVARVMAVIESQNVGLSDGDVIITGSAVTPIAVSARERVRVSFGDLGAVSVRLR